MAARMALTTGEQPDTLTGSGWFVLALVQHLAVFAAAQLSTLLCTQTVQQEQAGILLLPLTSLLQAFEKQLGRDVWREGVLQSRLRLPLTASAWSACQAVQTWLDTSSSVLTADGNEHFGCFAKLANRVCPHA